MAIGIMKPTQVALVSRLPAQRMTSFGILGYHGKDD